MDMNRTTWIAIAVLVIVVIGYVIYYRSSRIEDQKPPSTTTQPIAPAPAPTPPPEPKPQ